STRPVITSVKASTGPRNGMCWTLMPVAILNRSPAQCEAAPSPAEAKFSTPGLAFAAFTRSATVFQPFDGAATSTLGCRPNMATGTKAGRGWGGSDLKSGGADPGGAVNSNKV